MSSYVITRHNQMADSSTYRDERSEQYVRKENRGLVKDIVGFCSQRDYKKHNVLLIGQSGSGKSSIINTLLKVIIGEYMPRAKAGFGGEFTTSYTLQLKRYKNCGAKDTDFERREQQRRHGISESAALMKSVRDQLPDIFDAAGMKDRNDEDTKEILRLLIGGHIPPNINIAELIRLQRKNGLGYLPRIYRTPSNDYKMSMVIFACACIGIIPYNLIKCVREVLQEVDNCTSLNKYDTGVFLLITKYDKVQTDVKTKYSHTTESPKDPEEDNEENEVNETESTITLDQFNKVSRKITEAFIQTGTATHSQLNWASLNDSIGYDNVNVDNKALKLLKILTTPLHTDEAPPLNNPADSLNKTLVDLHFGLCRALDQNIQLSHVLMFLAAIVLLVGIVVSDCFGNVGRN